MPESPFAPGSRFDTVGSALVLPTVVFISVGNSVIFRNLADVPYHGRTALLFAAGFILCFVMLLAASRVAHHVRLARVVSRFAPGLAVSILLFDVAGSTLPMVVRDFRTAAVLDASIVGVTLWAAIRLPWESLRRVFAVVGILLFAQGTAEHVIRLAAVVDRARSQQEQLATARLHPTAAAPATARPNVYHILLDGFQGEAYTVLVARDSTLALEGFTHYSRFTSNYYLTSQSIPSLLTGRLLGRTESVAAWRQAARIGGLWGDAVGAGMRLTQYGYVAYSRSPLASASTTGAHAAGVTNAPPAARAIVDLWFLRLLPHSGRMLAKYGLDALRVTHDTLLLGDAVGQRRVFSVSAAVWPPPTRESTQHRFEGIPELEPMFSPTTLTGMLWRGSEFEAVLLDELRRPAHNQYVFWHRLLPHNPYWLHASCAGEEGKVDPRPPPPNGYTSAYVDAYLAQATCTMRQVRAYMKLLKSLDRYDESLIVIHSDHGMYTPLTASLLAVHAETLGADTLRRFRPHPVAQWLEQAHPAGDRAGMVPVTECDPLHQPPHTAETAALRSAALLLVKLPGATEFSVSTRPVQMIDLAPTILTHLGLPVEQYPGLALQDMHFPTDREVPFFYAETGAGAWSGGPIHRFLFERGEWRADPPDSR